MWGPSGGLSWGGSQGCMSPEGLTEKKGSTSWWFPATCGLEFSDPPHVGGSFHRFLQLLQHVVASYLQNRQSKKTKWKSHYLLWTASKVTQPNSFNILLRTQADPFSMWGYCTRAFIPGGWASFWRLATILPHRVSRVFKVNTCKLSRMVRGLQELLYKCWLLSSLL